MYIWGVFSTSWLTHPNCNPRMLFPSNTLTEICCLQMTRKRWLYLREIWGQPGRSIQTDKSTIVGVWWQGHHCWCVGCLRCHSCGISLITNRNDVVRISKGFSVRLRHCCTVWITVALCESLCGFLCVVESIFSLSSEVITRKVMISRWFSSNSWWKLSKKG